MEDKKFEEYLEKYSKENQRVVYSGGMSTLGVLGVVFVVLKLLGYISWSWVWVLAPFWIPIVLTLILLALIIPCVCFLCKHSQHVKETTEEDNSNESKTDSVNPFTKEGNLVLNSNKNYTVTPEFNQEEVKEEPSMQIEEKPKRKRSNKRKSKKNVESNTTAEANSNK